MPRLYQASWSSGLMRHGLVIGRDRLLEAVQITERNAPVVPGFVVVGFVRHGLVIGRDRRFIIAIGNKDIALFPPQTGLAIGSLVIFLQNALNVADPIQPLGGAPGEIFLIIVPGVPE
jgi:hypothetical protein